MPSASVIVQMLNGFVNTSSVTSTGAAITVFRRLIVSQTATIRMTDARM